MRARYNVEGDDRRAKRAFRVAKDTIERPSSARRPYLGTARCVIRSVPKIWQSADSPRLSLHAP